MLIEYIRLGDTYVICTLDERRASETKFRFFGGSYVKLILGGKEFFLNGDHTTVKTELLGHGILTPIIKTADGKEFLCEPIKCEAGRITPARSADESARLLAKHLAALTEKNARLEKAFSELYVAVYGKTIF